MTFKVKILPVFLCIVLFLFGCQKKQEAYVSASTTIRDNTPVCLVPSADGRIVFSNEYVTVDASNAPKDISWPPTLEAIPTSNCSSPALTT